MRASRSNAAYLPDVVFPSTVSPTHDIADAVDARPSWSTRSVARPARRGAALRRSVVRDDAGQRGEFLEVGSLLRMSEVLRAESPARATSSRWPGRFAMELARELPTAVAAATSTTAVEMVQAHFRSPALRLMERRTWLALNSAGAKNIIAIAAGVVEGLGSDTTPWPR
jgi:glycerol-3-phosphate dehydrogenase (NAD(P)+)